LSDVACEVVCAGLFCAEAGDEVIAEITTSKINIEGWGIMPHNKPELKKKQR
jgi:hypothetical protein